MSEDIKEPEAKTKSEDCKGSGKPRDGEGRRRVVRGSDSSAGSRRREGRGGRWLRIHYWVGGAGGLGEGRDNKTPSREAMNKGEREMKFWTDRQLTTRLCQQQGYRPSP